MQELALLVFKLAVGEEHPPQPGGLLGVNPALRQDVVLDGPVEELLEGRVEVLHPLVQFDEEVGPTAVDLTAGVNLLAQHFQLVAIDLASGQDDLLDLSQFHHDFQHDLALLEITLFLVCAHSGGRLIARPRNGRD
jgi:hypothetical protein